MDNTVNMQEKEINGKAYANIMQSKNLANGQSKKIAFEGQLDRQIAVFRLEGKLYSIQNICPHRHADKFHESIIEGTTITCPLHGWSYSLETGANTNPLQGMKKLSLFDIFEENGEIWAEMPPNIIPKWQQFSGK